MIIRTGLGWGFDGALGLVGRPYGLSPRGAAALGPESELAGAHPAEVLGAAINAHLQTFDPPACESMNFSTARSRKWRAWPLAI